MELHEINEFLLSVLDPVDQDLIGDVVDQLKPYELFKEICGKIDESLKESAFD